MPCNLTTKLISANINLKRDSDFLLSFTKMKKIETRKIKNLHELLVPKGNKRNCGNTKVATWYKRIIVNI